MIEDAPFRTALVANRGEIARRVIRACATLGVRSVAVASEADRDADWHRDADVVVPLAGSTATESYLDQRQILDAAAAADAEAIHPGYGFLSENAGFAAACRKAGRTFIGPPEDAIRRMGSKVDALDVAREAGVPTVPGIREGDRSDEELFQASLEIGYPLLVKASAGGGGRGMRLVREPDEFTDALDAARAEAQSAFGDDTMLLERYFEHARHIEVQVLGDHHGRVLHLFERECSIQRRYQKIIEEAPSPSVSPELRERITSAAVRLAEAVGYHNAGTVEFLVDEHDDFYFLEMNTRLQVEHPVTELVTGIDLVAWQLRVAAGRALPFVQSDLRLGGHAIEARVYAEDPSAGFLPSIGSLDLYRRPSGPGVRCDDGVASGAQISPHYDAMIAKVVGSGESREVARRRLVNALRQTIALGVTTNIDYLVRILEDPAFIAAETYTRFVEMHGDRLADETEPSDNAPVWLAAAVFEALEGSETPASDGATVPTETAWSALDRFRNAR